MLAIMYMSINLLSIYMHNSANDIKYFIENQQYREDQLRSKCHLTNFLIEPKKNLLETFYDDIKSYLTDNLSENMYPILYNSPIICDTYNIFIENSKESYNINRELHYNDNVFILENNNPTKWILEDNNHVFEISKIDIK